MTWLYPPGSVSIRLVIVRVVRARAHSAGADGVHDRGGNHPIITPCPSLESKSFDRALAGASQMDGESIRGHLPFTCARCAARRTSHERSGRCDEPPPLS